MKFIVLILIIILINLQVNANDCNEMSENYEEWERVLGVLIKFDNAIEIYDNKSNQLIDYAKSINKVIINEQIDILINNIDKNYFDFYTPGQKLPSKNIANRILSELIHKQGIYYYLFNKRGLTDKYKQWAYGCARYYDIKRYLVEFNGKLKWRAYYLPKINVYEVWFTIPGYLIRDFQYFHYRIKESNGKFILIGF